MDWINHPGYFRKGLAEYPFYLPIQAGISFFQIPVIDAKIDSKQYENNTQVNCPMNKLLPDLDKLRLDLELLTPEVKPFCLFAFPKGKGKSKKGRSDGGKGKFQRRGFSSPFRRKGFKGKSSGKKGKSKGKKRGYYDETYFGYEDDSYYEDPDYGAYSGDVWNLQSQSGLFCATWIFLILKSWKHFGFRLRFQPAGLPGRRVEPTPRREPDGLLLIDGAERRSRFFGDG